MKTFVLIMHLMVWDNELNMMRGLTFYEPEIPKYKSEKSCVDRGTKIIARAIENFKVNNIKTGEFEITCIEVKGEKA